MLVEKDLLDEKEVEELRIWLEQVQQVMKVLEEVKTLGVVYFHQSGLS